MGTGTCLWSYVYFLIFAIIRHLDRHMFVVLYIFFLKNIIYNLVAYGNLSNILGLLDYLILLSPFLSITLTEDDKSGCRIQKTYCSHTYKEWWHSSGICWILCFKYPDRCHNWGKFPRETSTKKFIKPVPGEWMSMALLQFCKWDESEQID